MERKYVSRASIAIEASGTDVWDALVNPATAKEYFFGAKVHSDWKEGSPITFTGEFNGNAYNEKGTILQYRPERLLQYSHWSDLEQLPDLPELPELDLPHRIEEPWRRPLGYRRQHSG